MSRKETVVKDSYNKLTAVEKSEISKYGCTVAEMRDAVSQRVEQLGSARNYAISLVGLVEFNMKHGLDSDINVKYDMMQQLARAAWVLENYVDE